MKRQIAADQLISYAINAAPGDPNVSLIDGTSYEFKDLVIVGPLRLEVRFIVEIPIVSYRFENCELSEVTCATIVDMSYTESHFPVEHDTVRFGNSSISKLIINQPSTGSPHTVLDREKNSVFLLDTVVDEVSVSTTVTNLYIDYLQANDKIIKSVTIFRDAGGIFRFRSFKLLKLDVTCRFPPSISLQSIELAEVNFDNPVAELTVSGCKITQPLKFKTSSASFHDSIVSDIILDGFSTLSVARSTVRSLELIKSDNGNVVIENSKLSNLAIGGIKASKLEIKDSFIDRLIFSPKLGFCESISISGSIPGKAHINSLNFVNGTFQESGSSKAKTSMELDGFSVSSLTFLNYINNAPMNISNLSFGPPITGIPNSPLSVSYQSLNGISSVSPHLGNNDQLLRIVRSDLGKINFVACDFSKMSMLFRESKITEIFLSDTSMPKQLTADSMKRTGYSQLRKIYEGRGDSINVVQYLAEEQNAYRSELCENKWWTHLAELIPLSLNKWSNYYGTSWFRALMTFVWFMPLIYIKHNRELGYSLELPGTSEEWKNFWELASLYLEFLIPIHKADFIAETVDMDVNNSSRVWDGIGRICSTYLIYQFIQAFRKYGKK